MSGILNGVNYDIWNPSHDSQLAATYDATTWRTGKPRCKTALQEELDLPVRTDVPLIGLIGRLADQKGWDLVADVMRRWVEYRDVQWVVLGTGETDYHQLLDQLSARYPTKVAACLEFADGLAHRIEAGADIFVMASRYEPCGLNQLYSLKYGSIPVVHHTGGLADTITDASPEHLAAGTANGFSFSDYEARHLEHALERACSMWQNDRPSWEKLVTNAMNQDWSWTRSAGQYQRLYSQIVVQRGGVVTH